MGKCCDVGHDADDGKAGKRAARWHGGNWWVYQAVPVGDWQYGVANGDASLGYGPLAVKQKEQRVMRYWVAGTGCGTDGDGVGLPAEMFLAWVGNACPSAELADAENRP
jgi:hypothetical protein